MYELRVKSHFDAAHFLPWHEGKCGNLHGHRWEVEVVIEVEKLSEDGIVADFALVKDIINRVVPDHQPLNMGQYIFSLRHRFPALRPELSAMADTLGNWCRNPTAERIAEKLYGPVQEEIGHEGLDFDLVEVTVWESPKCGATYRPGCLPVVYEGKADIQYPRDRIIKKGGCCDKGSRNL